MANIVKPLPVTVITCPFEQTGAGLINHAKVDSDLDSIRDDPRFKEMLSTVEGRLDLSS